MKIRPSGAELFYVDRRTDMMRLFAILRKASKNTLRCTRQWRKRIF